MEKHPQSISVICKILEQCKESKVFKNKNPWVLSLLNDLARVMAASESKTTLKYDITLLFN